MSFLVYFEMIFGGESGRALLTLKRLEPKMSILMCSKIIFADESGRAVFTFKRL